MHTMQHRKNRSPEADRDNNNNNKTFENVSYSPIDPPEVQQQQQQQQQSVDDFTNRYNEDLPSSSSIYSSSNNNNSNGGFSLVPNHHHLSRKGKMLLLLVGVFLIVLMGSLSAHHHHKSNLRTNADTNAAANATEQELELIEREKADTLREKELAEREKKAAQNEEDAAKHEKDAAEHEQQVAKAEEAAAEHEKEVADREQQMAEKEVELAEKEVAVTTKEQQMADKEGITSQKEHDLEEREKAAEAREKAAEAAEQEAAQHAQEAADKEAAAAAAAAQAKEKETQAIEDEYEATVKAKEEEAKEQEDAQKEEELQEKEDSIEQELLASESYEEVIKTLGDVTFDLMSDTQRKQVENFRNENALLLNVAIFHHAEEAVCKYLGPGAGSYPALKCDIDKDNVMPAIPSCRTGAQHDPEDPPYCYSYKEMSTNQRPWYESETGPFIEAIHPYFSMISWNLKDIAGNSKNDKGRSLDTPEWDHPNLVSAIVTRNPLDRLLAGDGKVNGKYPGYNNGGLSRQGWWDYALYKHEKYTDNFFLRILVSKSRLSLSDTQKSIPNHVTAEIQPTTQDLMEIFPSNLDEDDFEHAKQLLNNFTFVLDYECLEESLDSVADMLEMGDDHGGYKENGNKGSPRELIPFDDVYEYLLTKNKWDIMLYEYSKTISVVKCNTAEDVAPPTEAPVAQEESESITEAPTPDDNNNNTEEPTNGATTEDPTFQPTAGNQFI